MWSRGHLHIIIYIVATVTWCACLGRVTLEIVNSLFARTCNISIHQSSGHILATNH